MGRDLKKVKASYTVEMAMISGLWLLVIFASLLLLLGTYGKIADTAHSCEAAVYGSGRAVCRTGDGVCAAQERAVQVQGNYLISGNKKWITVTFDNTLEIPFGKLIWKRQGVEKSEVIRPVLFIEEVKKARRFLKNITD